MIQFNKEIINLQLVIPPENLCQEKFKKSNKLSDNTINHGKLDFSM